MAVDSYDVVTVGNYTRDTVVSAAGTRHVDGGGVNYAAHAAATLGVRVAAVTRLAAEDTRVVDNLKRAGIDVFYAETPSSTLMRLEYPTDNVDERVLTVAGTAGSITAEQVQGLEAGAFVISPSIRGEVPLATIQQMKRGGATICADVQGYIRILDPDGTLRHAEWPGKRQVLAEIDVLKTDAVEAASLTGSTDIRVAAQLLAEFGPREIVLTHRDGLLVLAEGKFHATEFHPQELIGRSGRGDTCLGSYAAKRLTADPAVATVWAAAVTSLKMEAEGPIARDLECVADLVRRKYADQREEQGS